MIKIYSISIFIGLKYRSRMIKNGGQIRIRNSWKWSTEVLKDKLTESMLINLYFMDFLNSHE